MNAKISEGLTHFGTTIETLLAALNLALAKGATYVDFFFEHTQERSLSLSEHKVDNSSIFEDYGVGVRVVVGQKSGYAYSTTTTKEALFDAVKKARQIAEQNEIIALPQINPKQRTRLFYSQQQLPFLDIIELKCYLESIDNAVYQKDSRVVQCAVRSRERCSKILFFNSLGDLYYDIRPLVTLSCVTVLQSDNRFEQGAFSRQYRLRSKEFFTPQLASEMVEKSVENASRMFLAIRPKGGEMQVVMAPGASGILLHEAIGHAFEADYICKKESIYTGKLGEKICNSDITIVDDGTIDFNGGALNYDDEGVDGQKTYLVTNGVLTSFLHDRISAKELNVAPTGNGRRESFREMPMPRMRATYMLNGNCEEQDLIRSVKKGVYVSNFTNGEVNIGHGDFTFYVKFGYLIENGVLTQPIKDINILGNGPETLANISAVGNKTELDDAPWYCRKEGQSVPVCCGMPAVKVDKLLVGGDE